MECRKVSYTDTIAFLPIVLFFQQTDLHFTVPSDCTFSLPQQYSDVCSDYFSNVEATIYLNLGI